MIIKLYLNDSDFLILIDEGINSISQIDYRIYNTEKYKMKIYLTVEEFKTFKTKQEWVRDELPKYPIGSYHTSEYHRIIMRIKEVTPNLLCPFTCETVGYYVENDVIKCGNYDIGCSAGLNISRPSTQDEIEIFEKTKIKHVNDSNSWFNLLKKDTHP